MTETLLTGTKSIKSNKRFGLSLLLPLYFIYASSKKQVSMIRKCHNHTLQTHPWHHEKERLNTISHKTSGRQLKQSNQLSLPCLGWLLFFFLLLAYTIRIEISCAGSVFFMYSFNSENFKFVNFIYH